MINQFRSIALNTTPASLVSPYTAYNAHIAPEYTAISLPTDLLQVYEIFYPTSNFITKLQLTHAYLGLLGGCGLNEAVTLLDSRVTYDSEKVTAFTASRAISVGIPTTTAAQDGQIALRVFNYEYQPAWLDDRLVRQVSIEQQTNTNNVLIFEDASQIGNGTLTFSAGLSNVITVLNPDNNKNKLFDFNIKHPGSPGFTATSGKKWTVTFTIPTLDLIAKQMATCKTKQGIITAALANYAAKPSAISYDQLWSQHFNDNYRLAGLFVGLIYRMNALLG